MKSLILFSRDHATHKGRYSCRTSLPLPLLLAQVVTLTTYSHFSFVSSWFTHGLASSYVEGCNVITAAVSTPANCMGHSLLFLWGREAHGSLASWVAIGGLWIFMSTHGAFGAIFFSLRQLEIARLVRIRPYNALAFLGPLIVFSACFLIYPAGQSSWFFGPSYGGAAIFRFFLFLFVFKTFTKSHFVDICGSIRNFSKLRLAILLL